MNTYKTTMKKYDVRKELLKASVFITKEDPRSKHELVEILRDAIEAVPDRYKHLKVDTITIIRKGEK